MNKRYLLILFFTVFTMYAMNVERNEQELPRTTLFVRCCQHAAAGLVCGFFDGRNQQHNLPSNPILGNGIAGCFVQTVGGYDDFSHFRTPEFYADHLYCRAKIDLIAIVASQFAGYAAGHVLEAVDRSYNKPNLSLK